MSISIFLRVLSIFISTKFNLRYKKVNCRIICWVFFLLIIVKQTPGQITLVGWNFPEYLSDSIADFGVPVNLDKSISLSDNRKIDYLIGVSSNAAGSIGWNQGEASKYWQINLNTQGFTSLILNSKQKSSSTGPADFKIIYSIDNGISWIEVPSGIIKVRDDWISGSIAVVLPEECNNQPSLTLRWLMSSNLSVSGGLVGSSGTSRIDDLYIYGCNIFIDTFFPSKGPPGTNVTIKGANFIGVNGVSFNGIASSYSIVDPNTIIAKCPVLRYSGVISIKNENCASSSTGEFQLLNSCPVYKSNIIISELCDPQYDDGTTRYIEIYNPTGNPIPLTGWKVVAISNGFNCLTWDLSGWIQPKEALTCGSSNPLNGGPHNFTNSSWGRVSGCFVGWNGERQDGAALYNGQTVVDRVFYENNNKIWFSNTSLIRNINVCNPSPVTDLNEWKPFSVQYAGVYPSTPRQHESSCTTSPPFIRIQPTDQFTCANMPVNFSITSEGIAPMDFQWKVYNTESGDWENINGINFSVSNTSTTSILTIRNLSFDQNYSQFYCEVKNYGEDCFQASNAVSAIIEDKQPPTFDVPPSLELCVEKIKNAVFNVANSDISPERPDFYEFSPGNTLLDLDPSFFRDNCPTSCNFQIRWKITMNDSTTIPSDPTLYFNEQPSSTGQTIHFPGDDKCLDNFLHTITYWIVDCAGNVSEPLSRSIIVNPRPDLNKN